MHYTVWYPSTPDKNKLGRVQGPVAKYLSGRYGRDMSITHCGRTDAQQGLKQMSQHTKKIDYKFLMVIIIGLEFQYEKYTLLLFYRLKHADDQHEVWDFKWTLE